MDAGTKIGFLIAAIVLIFALMRGCSEQGMTKSYGGEMEVTLEPNRKLVEITWKDSSLWYLTKPMTDEDVAEDYKFQEKDAIGMFEGTVTIHELKLSEEELEAYNERQTLSYDYNRAGNTEQSSDGETIEVYIHYDWDTDTYTKLKDYNINEETGALEPVY